MAVIVIDGPEKAGKSTLARIIQRRHGALIRKMTKAEFTPTDRAILPLLQEDVTYRGLVVWDRAWASEAVYGALLRRNDRLAKDPWLGEWLYGRAVEAIGVQHIRLGPGVQTMKALRDETDLPVRVRDERHAFLAYSQKFWWSSEVNAHNHRVDVRMADKLAEWARYAQSTVPSVPPYYAGPHDAKVVFVGPKSGPGWLPFSHPYGIKLARTIGDYALKCGWTNVGYIHLDWLSSREVVVAVGSEAQRWCQNLNTKVLHTNWNAFRRGAIAHQVVKGYLKAVHG